MKKYIKGFSFYALLLAVIFVIYFLLNYSAEPARMEFGDLINAINNEQVATLEITDNIAVIEKKEPETISVEFAGEHREGEFGYCTEFILKLKDEINQASFDEKTIFDRINPLGNYIVIV